MRLNCFGSFGACYETTLMCWICWLDGVGTLCTGLERHSGRLVVMKYWQSSF